MYMKHVYPNLYCLVLTKPVQPKFRFKSLVVPWPGIVTQSFMSVVMPSLTA